MRLTKEAIIMVIRGRCNLNLGTDKYNFSELYIQSNLTKFIKYGNMKALYAFERYPGVCLSKIQENSLKVKRLSVPDQMFITWNSFPNKNTVLSI